MSTLLREKVCKFSDKIFKRLVFSLQDEVRVYYYRKESKI